MASFYHDPLGFVLFAYPWGEPGPLEHFDGPDEDQRAFLEDLAKEVRDRRFDGRNAVMATRMAVSSGHGTGKSARAAWIVDWLMSTRPGAQGTVTANTNGQLATKTWAAIQHWTKLCITAHWFEMTSERMWRTGKKESWFCTPQSCREENSEAFAGQHALTSTSFYIFDEGSAVPDSIYEVAEGGLTDGEPMIFIFGNPTRNTGKLYRTVFGSERNRWVHRVIDARKSKFPNKAQIAEWIEDHGEDSDFVRVRVRGLPPQASDLQFIDSERVFGAQQREPSLLGDEPLIAGVDIARGGADNNVIRFRRGQDARSIKPIRIPGEETRDSTVMVAKLADLLAETFDGRKIHTMFVDGTGIGGPYVDRLKQLGHRNVVEVQFGGASPDSHYANMRSYMWGKGKDWLKSGAIDADSHLEADLTGPGYRHDKKDRVLLESKEDMKKRSLASPDDGDALCLTFAHPVVEKPRPRPREERRGGTWASN